MHGLIFETSIWLLAGSTRELLQASWPVTTGHLLGEPRRARRTGGCRCACTWGPAAPKGGRLAFPLVIFLLLYPWKKKSQARATHLLCLSRGVRAKTRRDNFYFPFFFFLEANRNAFPFRNICMFRIVKHERELAPTVLLVPARRVRLNRHAR